MLVARTDIAMPLHFTEIMESRSPFHPFIIKNAKIYGLTLYNEKKGAPTKEKKEHYEYVPPYCIYGTVKDDRAIGLKIPSNAIRDTNMDLPSSEDIDVVYPEYWWLAINSYENPTLLVLSPIMDASRNRDIVIGKEVLKSDIDNACGGDQTPLEIDIEINSLYVQRLLVATTTISGGDSKCVRIPLELLRARGLFSDKDRVAKTPFGVDPILAPYMLFSDRDFFLVYVLAERIWEQARDPSDMYFMVETPDVKWPRFLRYRQPHNSQRRHSLADWKSFKALLTGH